MQISATNRINDDERHNKVNSIRISAALLAVMSFFGASPAGATTLTFEGVVAANGTQHPGTPYTEAGYTLTNPLMSTDSIYGGAVSRSRV